MRALVVDPDFHKNRKWVAPGFGYLVEEIIKTFECKIIACQKDYDKICDDLEWVFITQPGWSAPWIKFHRNKKHKLAMMTSDPHDKTAWLPQYVSDNGVDYLLCPYWEASLKFLPTILRKKFVFFPWAIPDELCAESVKTPSVKDKLMIFGSMAHDAYALRRWCCKFSFVEKYQRSLEDVGKIPYTDYMKWLGKFGAIVCAGSWEYPFVFPKFYESASSGSLLFAQEVSDLPLAGFNHTNCVKFREGNFVELAAKYLKNPSAFDNVRRNGLKLIKSKHLLSHRLQKLEELFGADEYVERFYI